MEKLFFAFKVYDLIITNVHLQFQQSRSNVFRIFEEHSTNVYFKDIPRNENIFGSQIYFVGYPVKIVTLAVSSLKCFSELS